MCISAKYERECCDVNDVKIFSNGTCHWYREYQLSITHCPIDIAWFPFDDQVCELIYESKIYESRELNFTAMSHAVMRDFYIPSGEWKLLGMAFLSARPKKNQIYAYRRKNLAVLGLGKYVRTEDVTPRPIQVHMGLRKAGMYSTSA